MESNEVVELGKVVTYESKRVHGRWNHVVGAGETVYYWAWQYIRRCNCRYTFNGLTSDEADAKVTALNNQYARQTYVSEWNDGSGTFILKDGGTIPMAQVEKLYVGCDLWQVVCTVQEYDERWKLDELSDIKSQFTLCDSRTYY